MRQGFADDAFADHHIRHTNVTSEVLKLQLVFGAIEMLVFPPRIKETASRTFYISSS